MAASEKPSRAKILSLKRLVDGDAVVTIETANSVRYVFVIGPSQVEIITQLVSDVVSITQIVPAAAGNQGV
mgnify:CR=1 FL=1